MSQPGDSPVPIQHLVLFRLREEPGPEVEEEMRRQISRWVGMPGLRRLRFGRDILDRADGYQFGLFTEFTDQESYAAYVIAPLHQSFLAWVLERPFDVIRFDYPLTDATSLQETGGS
ncbi:MAG TPA: Dabb family protein [Candidatus Dormibacteraeota bacterium]|nr:Dabb family protein [Candidatus Dormibacteraeota bacterium]